MQAYVRSHGRTETSYHTKAFSVSGLAEAGNSSGSRGSLLVRHRPQTIPHSTGDYTLPPSSRPSLIPLAQSIVLFNKKKSEKKYTCAYQSLLLTDRRPQRYWRMYDNAARRFRQASCEIVWSFISKWSTCNYKKKRYCLTHFTELGWKNTHWIKREPEMVYALARQLPNRIMKVPESQSTPMRWRLPMFLNASNTSW